MACLRVLDNLSVLAALLAVCVQVRASCPTNWRYSSDLDMCYIALQPDSFDATLERCETAGGVLTSDLSKAALQAAAKIWWSGNSYWVGLEDKGTGEGLKLLDGSDVPDSDAWKDGVKPGPSTSRMCGIFKDPELTLSSCGNTLKTGLCERKPVSCPKYWNPIAGDCMRLITEKKSWEDANKDCRTRGASPMRIPTPDHALAIRKFLNKMPIPDEYQFWTGAKKLAGAAAEWDDGSSVIEHTSLNPFDNNKDVSGTECGFITITPEEAFLNLTEDCQALKDYACFLEGGSPKPATPPEIIPDKSTVDESGIDKDKSDDSKQKTDESEDSKQKSDKSDDSTQKSDKSEDSKQKFDKSEDSKQKSDKSDDSKQKSDKSDDSSQKSDKSDDSSQKSDKSDDSSQKSEKSDDSSQKSDKSDDSSQKSDKADDRSQKSDKSDDGKQKSDKSEDGIQNPDESHDKDDNLDQHKEDDRGQDAVNPNSSKGQMSGLAITGVVVGALALLVLVLVAMFVVWRSWPARQHDFTLRGNNSSDKVMFSNTFYKQEGDTNNRGFINFAHTAS